MSDKTCSTCRHWGKYQDCSKPSELDSRYTGFELCGGMQAEYKISMQGSPTTE